jgi:hypothetical protein
VPIRHPVTQVESLMRQHRLFTDYSAGDPRVPQYLRAAGHFEFGPQRVPVNIDATNARAVAQAWAEGADDLGYALMWRAVYSHVRALRAREDGLAGRICFVQYEQLCDDPERVIRRLAEFCELEDGLDALIAGLPDVSPRAPDGSGLSELERARVWVATRELAAAFGYRAGQALP